MVYAHILTESSVPIWGLTSRQRILRVLKDLRGSNVVEDVSSVPDNNTVLLLRGDYLYDDRLLNYLAETPDKMLNIHGEQGHMVVAAHVASSQAHQMRDAISNAVKYPDIPGVQVETLETLSLSFREHLRKVEKPFVLAITPDNRRELERRLFDWSYKGITDLITKWVWPRPAQWAVGQCVRFGLRPNHVTLVGLLLVILAGVLFAYGWYGWGLLAGWLMTFLDTVDGKLARVTVSSSRFGHYFDHIIDIVHPPIWYALWGLGLGTVSLGGAGIELSHVLWAIFIAYIVGRLVEGTFQWCLGRFGIFCWRPLDSYFRLITARRNPCLILLTAGTLIGQPGLGLIMVAIWTVVTSIFLLGRLLMALIRKQTTGSVRSWFLDIDQTERKQPLAVRLFTHTEN